jgi:hypothetical protein
VSTVGGGDYNTASYWGTTIGGGSHNMAANDGATVGGGEIDTAWATLSGIASGRLNKAGAYAADTGAFVGGGVNNLAGAKYCAIAGGINNVEAFPYAAIGGGINNTTAAPYTTIGGGGQDTASNNWATVSGGSHNVASGWGSMISGGAENVAAGTYSFAAGLGAHANHNGCLIYSDDYPQTYSSDRAGQVKYKAYGGVKFDINSLTRWIEFWDNGNGRLINTSVGAFLSTAGVWTNNSDRNLKENFAPLDGNELLRKINELPITRWNYKSDDKSITHIGPMAQDFKRLFEVGNDSTTISSLDPAGVALAGVQELTKQNQELLKKIVELEKRISELEHR